jgi:ADP-heptose:LPS heptosyltransferase
MGYGDELMATGFARGAKKRGKRIAFGDGRQIIWTHHSEGIFKNNPNIAPKGAELDKDIEWHPFYRGNRLYNSYDEANSRWIWNYDFRAPRGEVFFAQDEAAYGDRYGGDFVVIEPNVCAKRSAPNKQWSTRRYHRLAQALKADGVEVRQFHYPGMAFELPTVKLIKTPTFRHALAVLRRARLLVTCEGGLHHGAAAVNIPAVVIFGSFIPPEVTGYAGHENIAVPPACGSIRPCEHCALSLQTITLERVLEATRRLINAASYSGGGLGLAHPVGAAGQSAGV